SYASELSKENMTAGKLESLASIFGSSSAYVFMLVLSLATLILVFFVPKKSPKNTHDKGLAQQSQS
ncbi:MFS transporter, partial [Acinetobacter baumannii]